MFVQFADELPVRFDHRVFQRNSSLLCKASRTAVITEAALLLLDVAWRNFESVKELLKCLRRVSENFNFGCASSPVLYMSFIDESVLAQGFFIFNLWI